MIRIICTSIIAGLLFVKPCFSAFYLGAAVGPEGASFTQKSHVTRSGSFDVIDKQHFAGLGVFASILAGYNHVHNKFYLAGEVNANLSSLEYKLNNDEYIHETFNKTTFTIKSSEGVSILPGYFLGKKTLAYGRLGYVNGHLKIRESDPTIHNFNRHINGFRYGLGIRHALTPQWVLMMDYSQINYQSVKSRVFEPFGGVTKVAKITPNSAQVAFGLIYQFDQASPSTK